MFAGLCFTLLVPMNAFADVRINATNFPDANFRAYLLEQDYGRDGVITDEEIARNDDIDVRGMNISTLEGIQYFTALTKLICSENQLTSLDLSNNTALVYLFCDNNQLTSLYVSNNTVLTFLYCYNNQLTSLDMSSFTALVGLECYNNQLTSLNVSNCTELVGLECYNNQLTNLNVSNCTKLNTLLCPYNQLTSLDVSGCTALTNLQCYDNQLTSLDVSNNTELTELQCSRNQLTALDVSKNTALTRLGCRDNQLTSLNVSNNTALRYLYCENNQLTSLDVSGCTALTDLYCYDNKIKGTNLDALINSLPSNSGSIYIYDSTSETEENVCTKSQVAAIKEKWWRAFYLVGYEEGTDWKFFEEYEGADDTTGINAAEVGNGSEFGANAPAYDLNGNRVEGWQSKKGVYIVNGKKVVIK